MSESKFRRRFADRRRDCRLLWRLPCCLGPPVFDHVGISGAWIAAWPPGTLSALGSSVAALVAMVLPAPDISTWSGACQRAMSRVTASAHGHKVVFWIVALLHSGTALAFPFVLTLFLLET